MIRPIIQPFTFVVLMTQKLFLYSEFEEKDKIQKGVHVHPKSWMNEAVYSYGYKSYDNDILVDNFDLTLSGRIKRPCIAQVSKCVKPAWDYIRSKIVVKLFLKCSISNARNGTEDDALFNDGGNYTVDEYQSFVDEDDDLWIWRWIKF